MYGRPASATGGSGRAGVSGRARDGYDMFGAQQGPTPTAPARTKQFAATTTGSARAGRPASATGSMENLRSTDIAAGGTTRSDPGGRMFATAASSGVCFDEKVLKQISDNQTKFMQDRITQVERHFGDLCEGFGSYARGFAKLRDKGDGVAYALRNFAFDEKLNPSTKESLWRLGENFAAVQDYRETTVRRLEAKIVRPITAYGTSCKQAKERLRVACATRKRELDQKKMAERSRNPFGTRQFTQRDLQNSSMDPTRNDSEVEREIDCFEQTKLKDVKQIIRDFVSIEMMFHAKALELLSQCYQDIETIDEDEDLEYFRNALMRQLPSQQRGVHRTMSEEMGTTTRGSSRPGTLMSTATSDDSSIGVGRPPPAARPPQHQRQQAKPVTNGVKQPTSSRTTNDESEEEDDEDDYDDDDDDDDDDDEDDETDDEDDDDSEEDSPAAPVQVVRQKPVTSGSGR